MITVAKDHPHHIASDGRGSREVYLDGYPIRDVIECHETEGWAKVQRRHDDGRFMIIGDSLASIRLFGEVTVEFMADTIDQDAQDF